MTRVHHASRILVPVALALCLLTLAAWPVKGQGLPAVVGKVLNGTPGSAAHLGLTVELYTVVGQTEKLSLSAKAETDGSYRFDSVKPTGQTYLVRVVYKDVAYFSDPGTFAQAQNELSLPVTVYETTTDLAGVFVSQMHLILSVSEGRLQVLENYVLGSRGDRTYVGHAADPTARSGLVFSVPPGAANLLVDTPHITLTNGFVDVQPVTPGQNTAQVRFVYSLPYAAGMRIERTVAVPVASVALLAMQADLAVSGAGVTDAGSMDTQMGRANTYTAGPLTPGTPLVFGVSGQPKTSPGTQTERDPSIEMAIGLLILVGCLLGVWVLWRESIPSSPPARVRSLVEDIAALDIEVEAGGLSAATHATARAALIHEMRALLGHRTRPASRGPNPKG